MKICLKQKNLKFFLDLSHFEEKKLLMVFSKTKKGMNICVKEKNVVSLEIKLHIFNEVE